jgi:formylglycine-generating enzyme required for sulfatase activity
MDPYKILGIDRDATPEQIKRAYREKATKHHPDSGGDAWAFQQVLEAYEILTGKRKRKVSAKQSTKKETPAPETKEEDKKQSPWAEFDFSNSSKEKSSWKDRNVPPSSKRRAILRAYLQALGVVAGGIGGVFIGLLLIWTVWDMDPFGVFAQPRQSKRSDFSAQQASVQPDPKSEKSTEAGARSNASSQGTSNSNGLLVQGEGDDPELDKSVSVSKTLKNTLGMEFQLIKSGSFMMGGTPSKELGGPNEKLTLPVRKVTISKDFFLGTFEVTQSQYQAVLKSNPSSKKEDECPVDSVSWDDATKFCELLSELPEEKAAGHRYRLPTEAEWEYAFRAGTTFTYGVGNSTEALNAHAWFGDNSGKETIDTAELFQQFLQAKNLKAFDQRQSQNNCQSHKVGTKMPNQWGLHDMHGNVWEWCSDYLTIDPGPIVIDPAGSSTGEMKVYRGGCFNSPSFDMRASYRTGNAPQFKHKAVGFRVVLTTN